MLCERIDSDQKCLAVTVSVGVEMPGIKPCEKCAVDDLGSKKYCSVKRLVNYSTTDGDNKPLKTPTGKSLQHVLFNAIFDTHGVK